MSMRGGPVLTGVPFDFTDLNHLGIISFGRNKMGEQEVGGFITRIEKKRIK